MHTSTHACLHTHTHSHTHTHTHTGNTVRLYGQRRSNGQKLGGAPLNLPKIRKNRLIEIIPINTGCLNQCTYCKTKHARGDLGSYQPQEIVERAQQAFSGMVCGGAVVMCGG